jgi:DNA topoisomerase-3
MWEKKLRLIELGQYDVSDFMTELKSMVGDVVCQVKRSNTKAISIVEDKKGKTKTDKKSNGKNKEKVELVCPKCKKGKIVKGKTAWGCTNFKNGCDLRFPFEYKGKKISESNIKQLCDKGKTRKIKGFIDENKNTFDGILCLGDNSELTLLN